MPHFVDRKSPTTCGKKPKKPKCMSLDVLSDSRSSPQKCSPLIARAHFLAIGICKSSALCCISPSVTTVATLLWLLLLLLQSAATKHRTGLGVTSLARSLGRAGRRRLCSSILIQFNPAISSTIRRVLSQSASSIRLSQDDLVHHTVSLSELTLPQRYMRISLFAAL